MNAPAPPGHNLTIGEQCARAIEAAAEPTSEALRLDKYRKRVFAQCVISSDAKSVAKAEYEARDSQAYTKVEMEYLQAQTDANTAKAKADAWRVRWETWRTDAATERARMQMI